MRQLRGGVLRFLLPSGAGAALFLLPVPHQGTLSVPMGLVIDALDRQLAPVLPAVLLAILTVAAVVTPMVSYGPAAWSARRPWLRRLFQVGPGWVLLRIAAVLTAFAIVGRTGPEWLWGTATGQVMFDLALTVVTLFTVAAFLLPLLTEYGLMELVGAAVSPVFRRLFTLPGRAAVDATASWLSSAAVGVLITAQQYERGHYTAREACVIATNFSVVSLPFCLLVASVLRVDDRFFTYYGMVVLTGLVTAMVLPRLPPLRTVPERYADGRAPAAEPRLGPRLALANGWSAALRRAAAAPGLRDYLFRSTVNLADMWLSLLPGILTVGLLGVILAEHTPVFTVLSMPLVPLLELLGLPEAAAAAPTLLVGFVDMFLPVATGQGIEAELTRFVIAGVAVCQLIYLSEVGILILKLPIPLGFGQLVTIFCLRTVIATPMFAAAGHLLLD